MPYQNNNNRIVPDKYGLTSITPVAQVTDQQIKTTPQLQEAYRFQNMANALASLGRGITDADKMMQVAAENAAAKYIMEDDVVGNNKHDWEEATKRIKGLSRLNPYLKDSYKRLAGTELAKKYLREVSALPNKANMNQADFDALITENKAKYLEDLKNIGLSVNQAESGVLYLQNGYNELLARQKAANNENNYKLTLGIIKDTTVNAATQAYYNYDRETKVSSLGQFGKGNIDLNKRPKVQMEDGSIATVRSMSFNEDGKEVLIPTVSDDGKILSDKEAIKQYKETGKYLGKFNSIEEANKYAEELHISQQEMLKPTRKEALIATMNTMLDESIKNGVTTEEAIQTTYAVAKDFITRAVNDDNLDFQINDVIEALEGVSKEGLSLGTFDANWKYNLTDFYDRALREKQVKLDYEYRIQKQKEVINEENAWKDLCNEIAHNPNLSGEELTQKITEISENYQDPSLLGSLTAKTSQYLNANSNLVKSISMPDEDYQKHYANIYLGTETLEDIVPLAGQMTSQQFSSLVSVADRVAEREERQQAKLDAKAEKEETQKEKAALASVNKELKYLINQRKDESYNKKLKNLDTISKGYANEFNAEIDSLSYDVATGLISGSEAQKRLNALIQDQKRMLDAYDYMVKTSQSNIDNSNPFIKGREDAIAAYPLADANFNYALLGTRDYTSKLPFYSKPFNKKTACAAMSSLGIFRTMDKSEIETGLTSGYSLVRPNPTNPKEVKKHNGIDFAFKKGTPIYPPRGISGTVVSAGMAGDAGNQMVVRLDNNMGIIRIMHLDNYLKAGTRFTGNTIIGRVGNTGHSTGSHAHIECFSGDGKTRITLEELQDRIEKIQKYKPYKTDAKGNVTRNT